MPSENYENLDSPANYKNLKEKIILVLAFLITCLINGLTGAGKIGKSQKYMSDKYHTLITPPDYAFGIWGVIYFLWAVWIIIQCFPNTYLTKPDQIYSNDIKSKLASFILKKQLVSG